MKIEGHILKDQRSWAVYIPALDLHTHAGTKKEAYEMAGAVVEDMIFEDNFQCFIEKFGSNHFYLTANDPNRLIAFLLKRQRNKSGLTLRQAAAAMGSNSPNAFSVYELCKKKPTIDKLNQLLDAVGSEVSLKAG